MKKKVISLMLLMILVVSLCQVQSFANETISTVNITITMPKAGETPDLFAQVPSDANYEIVGEVCWREEVDYASDWNYLEDAFEMNASYAATIYVKPKEGYEFEGFPTININGKPYYVYAFDVNFQERLLTIETYGFPTEQEPVPGPEDGWQIQDGKYYYYMNGSAVTGWQVIDGKYYYFDSTGEMHTGWLQADGNWYYLNANGNPVTSHKNIGGKFYYFNKKTAALQVGFIKIGDNYYYFSKTDGTAQTGFVKDGGKYYYCSKVDGSVATGFVYEGGKCYYFNKTTGAMQFGWVMDGSWNFYYFNPSNGEKYIGWLRYGGYYYYLNPADGNMSSWTTGILVRKTTMTIDDKTYTFNYYGVCVGVE